MKFSPILCASYVALAALALTTNGAFATGPNSLGTQSKTGVTTDTTTPGTASSLRPAGKGRNPQTGAIHTGGEPEGCTKDQSSARLIGLGSISLGRTASSAHPCGKTGKGSEMQRPGQTEDVMQPATQTEIMQRPGQTENVMQRPGQTEDVMQQQKVIPPVAGVMQRPGQTEDVMQPIGTPQTSILQPVGTPQTSISQPVGTVQPSFMQPVGTPQTSFTGTGTATPALAEKKCPKYGCGRDAHCVGGECVPNMQLPGQTELMQRPGQTEDVMQRPGQTEDVQQVAPQMENVQPTPQPK